MICTNWRTSWCEELSDPRALVAETNFQREAELDRRSPVHGDPRHGVGPRDAFLRSEWSVERRSPKHDHPVCGTTLRVRVDLSGDPPGSSDEEKSLASNCRRFGRHIDGDIARDRVSAR